MNLSKGLPLSIILSILYCLTGSIMVQAQSSGSTTGGIIGTVKDPQQAALVGAVVTARHISTNLVRTTSVNEDGTYHFPQLLPGDYQLTVAVEGFEPAVENITLNLGVTALVRFVLTIKGESDVIEVKASRSVNETKTENSTNIDSGNINNLPINRRSFLDFTLTSPRATPDRLPVQGVAATSGISFNGQSARFNNITIDGLDNNDSGSGTARSTFSQEAVQEFQVITDSYAAEFGRAFGGIINIVTKSGSNDFHGKLFSFVRNDKISARDVFSPFEPPYRQYQFGTTLGGPVKENKIFFFTAFERLSIKQNNIVTIADNTILAVRNRGFVASNGPVPLSMGITSLLGRIDLAVQPNNLLTLRYNSANTYNGAFEPFGGLIGDTAGGLQRLNDNALTVSNTYINNGLRLVNETRFLYNRRDQDVSPLSNEPNLRINAPEGVVRFGNNTFLPQPRKINTYQILDHVSLTRGHHQLKFGGDLVYADTRSRLPVSDGGLVLFNSIDFQALTGLPGAAVFTSLEALDPSLRSPQQRDFLRFLAGVLPMVEPSFPAGVALDRLSIPIAYVQGFSSGNLVSASGQFISLFYQDDIRLKPNLLLKTGIRYDRTTVASVPKSDGNFSPRLAISYHPNNLAKLNVRVATGLFFAPLLTGPAAASQPIDRKILVLPFPFSVLPFDLPGHRFAPSEQLPNGVNFTPQLGQSITIQKDLRQSYTYQLSTGFDYFVNNDLTISVNYQFIRGIKILSIRDINPIVRPIPNDFIRSAIVGRIDTTRGSLLEFESAFDSYYHGMSIVVNKRFFHRMGFLAHYTLSKTIDNFFDITTSLQDASQNDPLRPGDERGLSLQDVRNRLVLSGIWSLSYNSNPITRDWQFSTIVTIESGRPYNLLAGVDLNMNGDNPNGDRPLGLGRNVGVTPDIANVDMRLTRFIKLKEPLQFEVILESFNLFNRVNISELDRVFPPDLQGNFNLPRQKNGRYIAPPERYRNAFPTRQFQIGVRVTF
ncbi:MAG: TonB-dependent receptor [Acidobacteriota bacterium]